MLADYRRWLVSELKLLGNASHHAYSFGQANMAKRAIEKLDEELGGGAVLALSNDDANALMTEIAALEMAGGRLPRGLRRLRESHRAAMTPPEAPAPRAEHA